MIVTGDFQEGKLESKRLNRQNAGTAPEPGDNSSEDVLRLCRLDQERWLKHWGFDVGIDTKHAKLGSKPFARCAHLFHNGSSLTSCSFELI